MYRIRRIDLVYYPGPHSKEMDVSPGGRMSSSGEKTSSVRLSDRPHSKDGFCMPASDKTIVVVREWVTKAENDLKSAAHLLKMKDCPVNNVCFNAQQCVEKYLKTLLITQGKEFLKPMILGN